MISFYAILIVTIPPSKCADRFWNRSVDRGRLFIVYHHLPWEEYWIDIITVEKVRSEEEGWKMIVLYG
jgi:hypothetical protein